MITFRSALVSFWVLAAGPALANCNPPPPGLGPDQWYALCTDVLNYNYQLNNFGMDYQTYVQWVYGEYYRVSNTAPLGGGIPGPMVACSGEGATYCPSSGYLLTCSGGYWLTGAATC